MRLLLITHSYAPDDSPPQKRWNQFIGYLRKQGWDVDVITPSPASGLFHQQASLRSYVGAHGEKIYRTPNFKNFPDTRVGRLAKAALESSLSIPWGFLPHRPDVVVATVPALPTLFSGRLISWLRRSNLVIDMRDAWPDLLKDAGIEPQWVSFASAQAITAVQKSADQIVTVSEGFAHRLRERGIEHVSVVPNSFGELKQLRSTLKTRAENDLNVLYLGNHGESQNLDLIIKAAAIARGINPGINVRFVGEGTQRAHLMELNESLGKPVDMQGLVEQNMVQAQYNWADTCIISLRPDWPSFDWTIPSKTYELLALGKHITPVVTGEAAALVEAAGQGPAVPANAEALAHYWLNLAESPEATEINEESIAWSKTYSSSERQNLKLESALEASNTTKIPVGTFSNTAGQLGKNAMLAATTVSEHLTDDPTMLGMQILRRLPQKIRQPLASTLSKTKGGPLDIFSAIGKATSGHIEEVKALAIRGIHDRKSPRQLVKIAEVLTNHGDTETGQWVLDRIRPGTKGLPEAQARLRWFKGEMIDAVGLLENSHSDPEMLFRLSSELQSYQGARPMLRSVDGYTPRPDRILHILTNSLPHTGSGYAQRSHSILLAMRDQGWKVSAVTRLGWPVMTGSLTAKSQDIVDGIQYDRMLPSQMAVGVMGRLQQQTELLLQQVLEQRPALLHTTTHWTNALVVEAVAKAVGIPWVYEVRGQLADTWASTRPEEAKLTERYVLFKEREAEAAKNASAVVTLGAQMKQDLLADGVAESDIIICPNAIGGIFLEEPGDTIVARTTLGLDPELEYVGTVSSLVPYEGLDTVLRAAAILMPRRPKLRLLIAGDGTALPDLIQLTEQLGIADKVIFPGRVQRDEAHLYHQSLDIFVVPRNDTTVTRKVTPMKSIEASASGKPVIASDLPALQELVNHEVTGLLAPAEDPQSWAEAIDRLLDQPDLRVQYGTAGREWALRERTWKANTAKYEETYERLLSAKPS